MFKTFTPFAHARNIYEIDVSFYKKLGIKYIFADLDNTLDSYKTKVPGDKAKELFDLLKSNGITLIIVSNNTGKRVSTYANALGSIYINSFGKPFSKKLKKTLKLLKIEKDEVILIGDQTLTDIPCGNKGGIKTLLVDKLVKEDQITTRFNRLFDIPMRKYLKKHNLLKNWEEF